MQSNFYEEKLLNLLLLLLSLYLKLTDIQKEKKKKKTREKIDVNLEHREHLATTQNKIKKSIVLIKVN